VEEATPEELEGGGKAVELKGEAVEVPKGVSWSNGSETTLPFLPPLVWLPEALHPPPNLAASTTDPPVFGRGPDVVDPEAFETHSL
jgi:hypothetical protein